MNRMTSDHDDNLFCQTVSYNDRLMKLHQVFTQPLMAFLVFFIISSPYTTTLSFSLVKSDGLL